MWESERVPGKYHLDTLTRVWAMVLPGLSPEREFRAISGIRLSGIEKLLEIWEFFC
jgi:hypothetical protein